MPSPMLSEVSDPSVFQPVLPKRVGLSSTRLRAAPGSPPSHPAQYRLPVPVPPPLPFIQAQLEFNYKSVPLPHFNTESASVPAPRRAIDCSSFEKSVSGAHNGIRHLASLKAHHTDRKGLQDGPLNDMESDPRVEDTAYQMARREAAVEAQRLELHVASVELKMRAEHLRTSAGHPSLQGQVASTTQQQQEMSTTQQQQEMSAFAEASACFHRSLAETSAIRNDTKREWTHRITAALSPRLNEKVADTNKQAFVQRRWTALQTSSFAAPHE